MLQDEPTILDEPESGDQDAGQNTIEEDVLAHGGTLTPVGYG